MKIRITGNNLRVRVSKTEADLLASGRKIEQVTVFSAASRLTSAVTPVADARGPSATFQRDRLEVFFPAEKLRQWGKSDEVGIEANQPVKDGQPLTILLEKDFQCLHKQDEGHEDAFPNPRR